MTIGSIYLLVRPIIEEKLSVTALSFPSDSEALKHTNHVSTIIRSTLISRHYIKKILKRPM